jgi:hypothetical protein
MLPRFADLESRLTLRNDREMSALEIWLPGCILVLAFVLKLFVDRVAGVPDFIAALIELPVDIAFLAISLVAAFTISDQSHTSKGLIAFVIYVVGAVIVVFLWRRSQSLFVADQHLPSAGVAILGYVLCINGLIYAVGLVSGAALWSI